MGILNSLSTGKFPVTNTPFAPSNLSGLALWLRSDNLVQSGGFVSQWTDLSPNANNVIQNTGGNQPTYNATSGPNSTPSVGFPASSHNLQSTTAVVTQGSDRSVFVVGTPSDPVSGKTYCASVGFNLSSPYCILSCSSSSIAGVNEVWNDGVTNYNTTDTFTTKTPHLIQWNYSVGSNIQFYIDGNNQNITYNAPCTTDAGGSNGISIGGFSNIWSGTMQEMIILNHIASPGEQNAIGAYVTNRYGITIS